MKTQGMKCRSERKAARWKKKLEHYRQIQREIRRAAPDILESDNFLTTKTYVQHGNMTVNAHVMNVARYSIALCERLHIHCNRKEMVRGALLHDYFLYDWHHPDKDNPHRLHGFFHPGRALRNASREYRLTKREKEIIKKHMWPLTIVPPLCREAWIVTAADKWCSTMETLHMHKGHGVVRKKQGE